MCIYIYVQKIPMYMFIYLNIYLRVYIRVYSHVHPCTCTTKLAGAGIAPNVRPPLEEPIAEDALVQVIGFPRHSQLIPTSNSEEHRPGFDGR